MRNIEIVGANEIIETIEKTFSEEKLEKALGKACALVERSAKELAPKKNGELKRSISSEVKNNSGIIYTPLEYAPYVEYGSGLFAENGGRNTPWRYKDDEGEWHTTSGMKPQPFLRPSLDKNREEILKIIKEEVVNVK